MHRSKSHTRAVAKARVRRTSSSTTLPSPADFPAANSIDTDVPPVADALRVVDLLDAHLDRLHSVRSVLWAMSALLDRAASEATLPRAVGFELQQLAKTGLGLAGESMDALCLERDYAANAEWNESALC